MTRTGAILPDPAAFGATGQAKPQKNYKWEDHKTFDHCNSIPIRDGHGDSIRSFRPTGISYAKVAIGCSGLANVNESPI
jgi:hypothetical protein